jgi:hypothetical protein
MIPDDVTDQLAFQKPDERLIQYLKEKSAARLENENKLLHDRHQIRLLRDL